MAEYAYDGDVISIGAPEPGAVSYTISRISPWTRKTVCYSSAVATTSPLGYVSNDARSALRDLDRTVDLERPSWSQAMVQRGQQEMEQALRRDGVFMGIVTEPQISGERLTARGILGLEPKPMLQRTETHYDDPLRVDPVAGRVLKPTMPSAFERAHECVERYREQISEQAVRRRHPDALVWVRTSEPLLEGAEAAHVPPGARVLERVVLRERSGATLGATLATIDLIAAGGQTTVAIRRSEDL